MLWGVGSRERKVDGKIDRIKIYTAKGDKGKELGEARLVEDQGLEEDFYARGGERQVSLLLNESRDRIAGSAEKGLCFSRFKENLAISGLAPDAFRPGVQLITGEAILEISGETKHCHEECSLFEAGKSCPLAGANLFARVLKGGVIRSGGRVTFCKTRTIPEKA